MGSWRVRVTTRAVVALLLLGAAVPAGAQDSDPLERLRENRSQLDGARSDLASVDAEVAAAQDELERLDGQLAAAQRRLNALGGDLSTAEAAVTVAAERTAAATAELDRATRELDRVEQRLDFREQRMESRVAAAYKYGAVTYADVLIESRDFSDFLTSYEYVRSALRDDGRLIDEISVLLREVSEQRDEVRRLRDVSLTQERAAASARDQVAQLVAEQQAVLAGIESDRAAREGVLAGLEATQDHYQALIVSLEAESAALADELRRTRWQAGSAPGAGTLVWPTDGAPGSAFGWRSHPIFGDERFHAGVDIGAPTGQRIVAAADGLVVSAGYRGGYGMAVVIDHGGGLATLYAHQSALSVSAGQVVIAGQTIGHVGATGYATGPHLHYEVRVGGEPQDPMRWY